MSVHNESSQKEKLGNSQKEKLGRARLVVKCADDFKEDVEILAILSSKANTQEFIAGLIAPEIEKNRARIDEYKMTLQKLTIQTEEITDGAGSRI